ncbi:sulfite exporter TauE/SafE family protein [Jannaschia aquimarina]|uniref:Probable membrane transporter protein n=1 Tax=Jannaschia aquimarina TaxID=935700 RepID=A0A0D1D8L8_9RHOB|nr:sulfite exporter TauE/SafE family protein [Jannaschia aquimarina]KIT16258.1 Sulfite exporter TauE/SafE [Jannaschia aquimarina]SNT15117.1 Sulfite exporter TauE/SafE [Jannaschia aquimarina]
MDLTVLMELGPLVVAAVILAAFLTSIIHGATGIGGGFLLAIVLAPLIGVVAVVPVLAVTLTISGVARLFFNRDAVAWKAYGWVMLTTIPAVAIGALLYGYLNATTIALILGTTILVSVPARRWAAKREITAGPRALSGAGTVYGFISGASVGAGMLLIPFLLGYGLSRREFVGSLAAIALTMNVARTAVFGGTDMLDGGWLALGLVCGLATLPGNWVGQRLLRGMKADRHALAIDVLTIFGGLNFYRIALG